MRRLAILGLVGILSLVVLATASAAPGRMIVAGCHPLAAGSEGPGMFVADPDGYDPVRLMWSDWAKLDPWCLTNPDWSPDGGQLVLQHECQLAVMDLAVLLPRPWPDYPDWPVGGPCAAEVCCCPMGTAVNSVPVAIHPCGWAPKWSPTGDRIAFSDGSVCIINPDGSDYKSLAPGGWDNLTWSADGLSIVFADDHMRCDLYLVSDLDNPVPSVTQLTSTPGDSEHRPVMSPDGLELAFSLGAAVPVDWDPLTDPLPAAGIWAADYPGLTTPRVLTNDPSYHDYAAAWDPDGTYVYFFREYAGAPPRPVSRALWRVLADGSLPEEPVPGLAGWEHLWGGVCFMKGGIYGTSTYALPGYTDVPLSVGVVAAENLAGVQSELSFRMYWGDDEWDCCPLFFETMDSCAKGALIDHWTMVGPSIDQTAGWVRSLVFGANPELDRVSGSGALLDLTATLGSGEEIWWDEGRHVLAFDALDLSDDWGEPIQMEALAGGVVHKPFSYLELSAVPEIAGGDEEHPAPFPMTIAAYGDLDELLTGTAAEVSLCLETETTDELGRTWRWRYYDAVSPTSVALVGGVWSGDVELLEPAEEGACIVAKRGDFGGCSNPFHIVGKADANGDDVVNVFDVIIIANIAIGRCPEPPCVWEEWELWAADVNGDGVVNVFDVILAARRAMEEMEGGPVPVAVRAAAVQRPSAEPPEESVTVMLSAAEAAGETVVSVNLSNGAGLAGIQVELEYDSKRLEYLRAEPGELLDGTAGWTVLGNDLGGVVKAIAYTSSLKALPGGEGAVLNIVFEKLAKKSGKLSLTSVQLSDAQGDEISSTGSTEKGGGKDKSEGKGK